MQFVFWLSLLLIVYIYLGYPLLLALLARGKKPVSRDRALQPSVSILIAAYNEADCIKATLINKLGLDYPRDKMEIIVVSDASSDATDQIVTDFARHSDVPVKLVRQPARQGKTAGLNRIAPMASGDIIVFSDANSLYAEDALQQLVAGFADPAVGYITGKMVYTNPDGSLVGDGCSSYMKYENWLREKESLVGSIVGVDGGIDAMRRDLYEPLRADQLPDFVQPLKVVAKGYRVVYEERAVLKENALSHAGSEYTMRVRVALRALWAMQDMKTLFNPLRYGLFSWQLLSHKLLRYLAFLPLLAVAVLNPLLAGNHPVYSGLLLAQAGFYLLAWLGKTRLQAGKAPVYLSLPYYFTLLNVASAHACWRYLKREKQVIWKPREG